MTTWKFTFGRHRDKEITDPTVPNGYIEWILGDNDNGEPRLTSERFREALTAELSRRKSGDSPSSFELASPARPAKPARPGGNGWSGNDRLGVAITTQLGEVLVRLRRIEAALGTPIVDTAPDDDVF